LNYQKIYDDICKRGQIRQLPKEIYTEKHHIVPKCLGGTNEKSNLTVLTAREHFLVHLILARKLYPKNPKLWTAMHYMLNFKTLRGKEYIFDSKRYELLRIEINVNLRGQVRSQEFKDNMSKARRGIPRNPDFAIYMMENHPRANKLRHVETNQIFNSRTQAASYFNITRDIINTQIKHGIFQILTRENQKITEKSFVGWLRNYLQHPPELIDVCVIREMIDNVKSR